MPSVAEKLGEELLRAAQDREAQLDEEIQRLDALKEDDLGELRRKRLESMKSNQAERQKRLAIGHGEYQMIEEKDFFDVTKKSDLIVVHFWRPSTQRCEIMDKHLKELAHKYWRCRFVKINAEKSPYLTERLHIWMLPSVVLCKGGKTEHTIVGFDEMGGSDDFPMEVLEEVLAARGMISLE